jgi:peptidoglycan/LPS O-acetylase OafA/YrhL
MPKPVGGNARYMPGLDGLRAIAVLAVIAYHLNLQWAPGGLLGVTMFFVLSGYLITDILLKQLGQNKTLDLKIFFYRRARRLLPAMFLMLAVVSLWLWFSDPGRLAALGGDIGSALLYVSNWYLIFHEVSYFESFGPASPFGHLWSLAVEEQFYLVWPLLLAVMVRFMPQRGKLALVTFGMVIASALGMLLLYEPGADPSRVYYGTDTRAFALLLGALLAIVWPSRKLSATISARSRNIIDAIGLAGLIVTIAMIATAGEYDPFLYQGGMVLLSVATAASVAALAHPASRISHIIGSKAFTWVGVRSYGIYLYHYPIIVLTTPAAESAELHPLRAVIQLALTLIVAELSWRFIEEPIRHGILEKLAAVLKRKSTEWLIVMKRRKTTISVVAAALVVFGVSGATAVDLQSADHDSPPLAAEQTTQPAGPPTGNEDSQPVMVGHPQTEPPATPEPTAPVQQTKPPKPSHSEPPASKPSGEQTAPPVVEPTGTPEPSPSATAPAGGNEEGTEPTDNAGELGSGSGITVIGDSVLLDIEPFLSKLLPGIFIDGKVGRQFSEAADIIEALDQNGKLGDTVVIELGTNGSFTTKQMNRLLEAIGPERKILMINTRVPRKWQDSVNEMLAETADKTPNVSIVDWYAASEGRDDFFSKDGVHLKKTGAVFYADMLANELVREQ